VLLPVPVYTGCTGFPTILNAPLPSHALRKRIHGRISLRAGHHFFVFDDAVYDPDLDTTVFLSLLRPILIDTRAGFAEPFYLHEIFRNSRVLQMFCDAVGTA
jgi:hypothetical protein